MINFSWFIFLIRYIRNLGHNASNTENIKNDTRIFYHKNHSMIFY